MGIGNVFMLSQVTIYLLAFILSFFMFVPVSLNLSDFDGHCLLFATGTWTTAERSPSLYLVSVDWDSTSACSFSVFTGVAVMLVSLIYVVWYSVLLFRNVESTWLGSFLAGAVNLLLTIFTFAAGLSMSLGFRDWCQLVTDQKSTFKRCEDGDYVPFGEKLGINTRHFYMEYQIAQFGVWSAWICELSLFILSVIKLCRFHNQEAFLTSMNRERQRLIQRVQSQSSYSTSIPT